MNELKQDLNHLNTQITDLEKQISDAVSEAENNIQPLNDELLRIREEKRQYALKNDFESVQECNRREDNLKFKINAQWNKSSLLKGDLSKLKSRKTELEAEIKLEEDKIRRNNEILSRINLVLTNYKKTHNLKTAAVNSKINPDNVEQWLKWGENNFNDNYTYFYNQKLEIDNHFKQLEKEKLINEMDKVIDAYRKSGSLEKASKISNVNYDTVQYWYEWGSRGFGEENTYFYRKINEK